ncbi:hypothetical protein BV22DRAFT_226345 [Leucogyrophana mollusca]|uniref:Uncharacterized protein n=1 Tax=Leucogyrophana mollusca TaxID=85980 RepID=A0ACB8BUB6_9AGAM|nr:hypothetical protein BV22DRAFT_226345 [Leucogyrophana mollusca]
MSESVCVDTEYVAQLQPPGPSARRVSDCASSLLISSREAHVGQRDTPSYNRHELEEVAVDGATNSVTSFVAESTTIVLGGTTTNAGGQVFTSKVIPQYISVIYYSSPPQPTQSSPSARSTVGIAVGGVVAGLVGLAVVIATVLCIWRRKRTKASESISEMEVQPFVFDTAQVSGPFFRQKLTRAASQTSDPPRDQIHLPLQAHNSSTGGEPRDVEPHITDEQADFINDLHMSNMPSSAIARVMGRMLARRESGGAGGYRRLSGISIGTAPPGYDYTGDSAESPPSVPSR